MHPRHLNALNFTINAPLLNKGKTPRSQMAAQVVHTSTNPNSHARIICNHSSNTGSQMTAFLTIFLTVFLAELGDKTQLATVLFASDGEQNRWLVFAAACSALAASTGIAILLGLAAERWLSAMPLKLIAGLGFVTIGGWMILVHIRTG